MADTFEEKVLEHVLAHQRELATVYADDARRAYQRRVDSVSLQEGYAIQAANTSRIAQETLAVRLANQNPPARA